MASQWKDPQQSLLAFGAGALAMLIVVFLVIPALSGSDDDDQATSSGPTRLGGTIAVTGARTASLQMHRPARVGIGIESDDGRLLFQPDPTRVSQLWFDGMSFFPDSDDCIVRTGSVNGAIGVVHAEVTCTAIEDVRGKGVVSLSGTIGLPAILLGSRGDLPSSGGDLAVGVETLRFDEAHLRTWSVAGESPYNMQLSDEASGISIFFSYDHVTHAITVSDIARDATDGNVPRGACATHVMEVGRLGPHDAVVELSVRCQGVEVPGMGAVEIEGQLLVDVTERRT